MNQINLSIPGYIRKHDLEFLAAITQKLPAGSTIFDIGCGWGREAWVFSKCAPSAKIYCLDTWDWKPTWKYVFKGEDLVPESERVLVNSREEFLKYTEDCPNIIPVTASQNLEWSGPPADFIFYDEEDESFEIIRPKLQHWLSHLKEDGILAGTDFYPYTDPPVKSGLVEAVRRCAFENNLVLIHNTSTSIWQMIQPKTYSKWAFSCP